MREARGRIGRIGRRGADFDSVPAPVLLVGIGAIDPREIQRVEHHLLAGCTECELVLESCAEISAQLARMVVAIPPSDVGTRRAKKYVRAVRL